MAAQGDQPTTIRRPVELARVSVVGLAVAGQSDVLAAIPRTEDDIVLLDNRGPLAVRRTPGRPPETLGKCRQGRQVHGAVNDGAATFFACLEGRAILTAGILDEPNVSGVGVLPMF